MITVEVRALGRRKALVPEWSIPTSNDLGDHGDEGLTLRELIERVVREQVRAFKKRQEARKFVRALTEREIAEGQTRGKIDPGGRDLKQEVNADHAVANALQAFEDGLYLVLIDDVEQKSLDAQVWISANTRMLFLRLTFLAGG